MNEVPTAEDSTFEAFKHHILNKLGQAGPDGLAGSRLTDGGGGRNAAEKKNMLERLTRMGVVVSERRGATMRYWLPERKPTTVIAEEKADEILRELLPMQRPGHLYTLATIKNELLAGQGIKEEAVKTCVRLLVQERLLIMLSTGDKVYYAYAPGLRDLMPTCDPTRQEVPGAPWAAPAGASALASAGVPWSTAPTASPPAPEHAPWAVPWTATPPAAPWSTPVPTPPATPSSESGTVADGPHMTVDDVMRAYRKVRNQRGLADVEISKLHELLECPLDDLKELVQQLCQDGVLVPGRGDWSFATAANRAAAILIHDVPHIYVRLKE